MFIPRGLVLLFLCPLLLGCAAARERAVANDKRRAEHIEKLKAFMPANVLKDVDPEFYTYPGFRNWYRVPLVYPYSIVCLNDTNIGHLAVHDGKTKVSEGGESLIQGLTNFTALSFDAKFLVGHIDKEGKEPLTEKIIFQWVLFEFATGNIESYQTQEELSAAARARGFNGDLELTGVATHFSMCFE